MQPFKKGTSLLDQATPIAGLLSQLTELLGQAKNIQARGRDGHAQEMDQYEMVDQDIDDSEEEDENAVEDTDSD